MSTNNRNLSINGPDFGDDDDIVLPDDAAFDTWLGTAAPSINQPGDTPRAEMWEQISARVPQAAAARDDASVRPFRRPRIAFVAALAAALILGIAIDRTLPRAREVSAPVAVHTVPDAATSRDPNHLYHLAAQQTLTQAELLLTAYRASDVASRDPASVKQLTQWGRQVLGSTRLLIDSPAGDDPRLKPLLEDLEVVLVQIIRLSGEPLDASERALIDGAITNRHLLPRIRSEAVPAGNGEGATD